MSAVSGQDFRQTAQLGANIDLYAEGPTSQQSALNNMEKKLKANKGL